MFTNLILIKFPNIDTGLESLDDAETFEPEFNEPKSIQSSEISSKLKILEASNFFDSPRSVGETVQQLENMGGLQVL